ncbi:MAG TPA: hypothetical protein VMH89_02255 [Candidatus Acidoferrum sp.]|nr:hypothetical protein [Candidatus Acidoferrum sp.]
MKKIFSIAVICGLALLALGTIGVSRASAQDPILTPIIVSEVAPIVIKTLTPKPKNVGLTKFEGTVVHANIAQITVRAKGNDLGIQTFALDEAMTAKMQKIVDNGGYQYGDKVTLYYDESSHTVKQIKGKPSRPL